MDPAVDSAREMAVPGIDILEAEQWSGLEDPLCIVDLAVPQALARAAALSQHTRAIVVGVDRAGALPPVDGDCFDLLLTVAKRPPMPWTNVNAHSLEDRIGQIGQRVRNAPIAASVCMTVLRITERLEFDQALQAESLAYSTLLGGEAFRQWRIAHPGAPFAYDSRRQVDVERTGSRVTITLDRPDTRNGMSAAMRDALFEALAATLDDPTRPDVTVRATGACFSTGGVLDEFGQATDLAQAHAIRTARSAAALLHRLGDRAAVTLHGACIGSGIEIPAAAAHRVGMVGAFFQLPELSMGLMPGAGGTVTLPRAIGRHRTAYMILSGRRIDAPTALDWGLLHMILRDG